MKIINPACIAMFYVVTESSIYEYAYRKLCQDCMSSGHKHLPSLTAWLHKPSETQHYAFMDYIHGMSDHNISVLDDHWPDTLHMSCVHGVTIYSPSTQCLFCLYILEEDTYLWFVTHYKPKIVHFVI